ncbi:hypothetical protein BC941DRAFT_359099, partial [Chlamydoabsidia padenii]
IYHPPYSPELNPIDQFRPNVKYSIKKEALLNSDTLRGYIRHSISRFDDCLNGNPINVV